MLLICLGTVTFKPCQGDTVNLEMGSSEFSILKCKYRLQSVSKFIVFYSFNNEGSNNERRRAMLSRKDRAIDLTTRKS